MRITFNEKVDESYSEAVTQTSLNELFNDNVFTCTTRLLVHVRNKTRH